jgi:kynurenine formamidase
MNATPAPCDLPKYRELARLDNIGANHSWGVFGPDDNLGTLNLLDERALLAAAATVRTGERIGLSLALHEPDPPLFRREPYQHTLRQIGSMWDDRLDNFFPQGSSQWDGFRHHRVREHGFYGGVTDDPAAGKDRLSIHHWARGGIIGRGVLLDVAGYLGAEAPDALAENPMDAALLRAVADAQAVEVRSGDVLCLRTGWLAAYRGVSPERRQEISAQRSGIASTGLAADEATAELLWDWHISAVTADNPAVEVTPGDKAVGSLHRRLLAMLGIPLGELFDFDTLAARLSAEGRWEFMFVSVPLALAGGLGSPANAVAIL